MLKIRPEKKGDYEAIYELNKTAFGGVVEAKLVDAIRSSEYYIPDLSIVAEESGSILGHILFSKISIEAENMEIPAIALAPMAVLPAYQGKGIGSTLVREGMRECMRLGHRVVVVIGHAGYYPRFGFVSASSKGLKSPFPVPDESFMVYEVDGGLRGVGGTVRYSEMFYEE